MALALFPNIDHPPHTHTHPLHHTGSHLLWQTASVKLLTPVVLIQGVTGDPSLANRRKEAISLSIHLAFQSPVSTGCPELHAGPKEQSSPESGKRCTRPNSKHCSSSSYTQASCTRKLRKAPLAHVQDCLQTPPELRRLRPSIFPLTQQGHLPFTERGGGDR